MEQKIISSQSDVKKFLKKIHEIYNDSKFNINLNFIMEKRRNDLSTSIYSNINTMLLLDLQTVDVLNEILQLEVEDYKETILDCLGDLVFLFVFIKKIKGEKIYIKISIRNNRIIFCISFHISDE